MKIGIIGSNGFIGKKIYDVLSIKHSVIGITKYNLDVIINSSIMLDVLINVNGNSIKYISERDPMIDFEMNVYNVMKNLQKIKFDKYIHISSIDAINKEGNYGFHKYIADEIVRYYVPDSIILRCSAVIGHNMKKGLIFDILNENEIRLTKDSKLQFITNTEIANIVDFLINNPEIKNETFIVSGKESVSVEEIEHKIQKVFNYSNNLVKQVYSFEPSINNIYKVKSSIEYVMEVFDNERME